MSERVHYTLYSHEKCMAQGLVETPFVIGRQSPQRDPVPFNIADLSGSPLSLEKTRGASRKLVIVPMEDRSLPRLLMRVDASGDEITVTNLHESFQIELADLDSIGFEQRRNFHESACLYFADRFQLSLATEAKAPPSISLPEDAEPLRITMVNIASSLAGHPNANFITMLGEGQTAGQELAIRLVRDALEAFKEPPGSEAFFHASAKAAAKMIDLDRVAVLTLGDAGWTCRAQAFNPDAPAGQSVERKFSQTLLQKMVESSTTCIVQPEGQVVHKAQSIVDLDRAVAAPIFNEQHQIIGALYGDRALGRISRDQPIGELEAVLLDVLASGISSSLVVEREQQLRSCMSQFFSPVVLSQLSHDRELLLSREADVSVLFCDVRGFSAVTEKIGPTRAIDWINDILSTLSECVLAHDGVLVDYVGDELMAMWGAPAHQADHAERACRAALDMLATISPLGEKWSHVVPDRFGFGIGINSGPASVGNTGSRKKFKYGPLGTTVNLASRVQGITKQIGVPGLITGDTALSVQKSGFQTRRLTPVRVVGIQQPIEIHQLCTDEANDLCLRYEAALDAFENQRLPEAAGCLASLVQDYKEDRPTIILLSRTVEQLTQSDQEFDSVWNLTRK